MTRNTKGEWVKYESEPGEWKRKWNSEESSYTRLCNDLKEHKSTGWNSIKFDDYIYGEMFPSEGIYPSDVYIYYETDKTKRKPKLCLIYRTYENGDFYYSVLGLKRRKKPGSKEMTFTPKAKYLPVLLEKLKELNATKGMFKEEEESLLEYQALIRIAKEGVKTPDDILTIYRNFTRIDTYISRTLVKERNVQEDYNSLNDELKIELVKILRYMNDDDLATLGKLTKVDGELLSIESIDILKKAVASLGLKCLRYAPIEYRCNKEKILEILSLYGIENTSALGIDFISKELQTDIDVLQSLIKEHPANLFFIIMQLKGIIMQPKGNMDNSNKLLNEKLKNRKYMLSLLDMYFRSIIRNQSYIKESFIPTDIMMYFTPEMLDNLEKKIVYGPFANEEEEQMKNKVSDAIKLELVKIRDSKK